MIARPFKTLVYLIIVSFLLFVVWLRPNIPPGIVSYLTDNDDTIDINGDDGMTKEILISPQIPNDFSEFKICVHIFSSPQRYESFLRLWDSINSATKAESAPVELIVHINTKLGNPSVYDSYSGISYNDELLYTNLSTQHGLARLHISARKINKGQFILGGWTPSSENEYAILLEDDVTVSSSFFHYAERAIKYYYYSSDRNSSELAQNLLGLSLHPTSYDDVNMRKFNPVSNNKMFLLQFPDSFGGIYSGAQWLRFLNWFNYYHDRDVLVPYSLTNRWKHKAHWRKYLFRWMFETGKIMAFPSLPNGASFVTFHETENANKEIFSRIEVAAPTLLLSYPLSLSSFPPLSKLAKYDAHFNQVDSSTNLIGDPTPFEKCTMVITVYSRHATIRDRLNHYHSFESLSAIIVVWNKIDVDPPELGPEEYNIPVYILRQEVNSINNRFKPHKEVKTSCVINMDDDWDMPQKHIRYVIDVWQKQFFNSLVGFRHEGRSHIMKNNKWAYSKGNDIAVSIMLPSGFVYDSKYLDIYTNQIPAEARNLVDEYMNCDDILFNFMFANATGRGPVAVNYHAKMLTMGMQGLWSDKTHFIERDDCVDRYSKIYHGMPLRFTNYFFTRETCRMDFMNDVPPITEIKYFETVKEALIDRMERNATNIRNLQSLENNTLHE